MPRWPLVLSSIRLVRGKRISARRQHKLDANPKVLISGEPPGLAPGTVDWQKQDYVIVYFGACCRWGSSIFVESMSATLTRPHGKSIQSLALAIAITTP
ncbi:hypothetical protein BJX63DRAFT_139221 [Aspergillus granulosus]|uniref:Uncharacterized protein n=1 Tax=Aspergillus granulosus TaxID=176169 RepID=A0ABR4HM51_9EURO